ncbi:MAG: RNA pseudouridine synthase [Puniceicoccales bacterium]|jgi:23S rRNA-/tRNA-specific pseudouridylate synthase|nr:RNA pseudouridine synthase [Puniceicoccales bacterium]
MPNKVTVASSANLPANTGEIGCSILAGTLHSSVSVAYCDQNGLIALEKPCGVLSHPNNSRDTGRSLLSCDYDNGERCYTRDDKKIYLLNRLDSPVSGLVLIAMSTCVAQAVKATFDGKKVLKQYLALAKGFPRHKTGTWRSRLEKNFSGKSIKMSTGSGIFAETKYEVVNSFRLCGIMMTILKLFPVTGRTHQLRIHCSQNGLPIVGDKTYGDTRFNASFVKNFGLRRMLLHSESISLLYFINGKTFQFSAKSLSNFRGLLENFQKSSVAKT